MPNAENPLIPLDGTVTFTNGVLTYILMYEGGDLQVSGLKEGQMATQVFKDRGIPYAVRATERDEAIEFTFTCDAVAIVSDGTTATVGDVILKKKVWAAATSTLPAAAGDAYCVTTSWVGERIVSGGATGNTGISLKYCRLEADFQESIPGKFSVKGKAFCYSNDYVSYTP